jgi:hypothetical protein
VPPDRSLVAAHRLFYHYLQKELLKSDIWLFQMLTARLIVDLGIWLHPRIYERLPVVVPYAFRDPLCRPNKKTGRPDSWGAPDARGLFRDDNSLVKGLPRSLNIRSHSSLFKNRRIGTGFVAAHVWRELTTGELASRDPVTYSFVPNLVWLPADVAALTDREGSFVQTYVQALSMKIFRHHKVTPALAATVEDAWSRLPPPMGIPEQGLPELSALSFFEHSEKWLEARVRKVCLVADALAAVTAARPIGTKAVISDRYTNGLPHVAKGAAQELESHLRSFVNAA